VTVVAGSSSSGSSDGAGTNALFTAPLGISVNTLGNLFLTDYSSHSVRTVNTTGVVSTIAGLGGTSGFVDGSGTNARFRNPFFVALSSDDTMYVADYNNAAIRRVTSGGVVSTLYSSSNSRFRGISFSTGGVLYASEYSTYVISTITTSGTATRTVFVGSGSSGSADGVTTQASFSTMNALVFNTAGVLYVADEDNHCVRKITATGNLACFPLLTRAFYATIDRNCNDLCGEF
jgi:sugar lactone lactonase YvrE